MGARRFCTSTGFLPAQPTGCQPVVSPLWTAETPVRRTGKMPALILKSHCELGGEQVRRRPAFFVLKAVLQLQLDVGGEPVASGHVGPPDVPAPRRCSAVNVGDVAEELLVPADRAEKLRGKLVFHLEVISERVGVGEPGYLESRLKEFRPELPMVPGEPDVLAEQALMIIADIMSERQSWHSLRPEIRTVAGRESKGPHFVGPKPEPPVYGGMLKIPSRDRPRLRPRRQRRGLDLGRVIELPDPSRHRNAGGVARAPDHGVVLVFLLLRTDAEIIVIGSGFIFDRRHILVGQWCVDEWVVPGEMARDPVADDGGKLADLESEPAIRPGREAEGIFVQTQLRPVIAWIETAIKARLGEEVNSRTELGVDEQAQPRINERIAVGQDETGSRAAEMVGFEIKRAAHAGTDIAAWRGECERFIDPIKKILCRHAGYGASDKPNGGDAE